jgi:tRNA threonylcarbamoyl adenosine modification protein YeaZ
VLLAIDTSAGTSVAVVDRDAGVLSQKSSFDTRGHAEIIGTLIAEALADAGVPVTALSGVAVGMGPGPFTGLRVGIAAAFAFAFGAGKPTVNVVSHDAIAFGLYGDGETRPVLVVTDARRREVYWSAYSGIDAEGLPVRVAGPSLCKPDELADEVEDFTAYTRVDAESVSAASVGLLAEGLYANKRAFAGSEALYLRSPDAKPGGAPKRVS